MKEKESAFEFEYTQTLFYFAQLWTTIGNKEKSAWYCFRTLERQLREDMLPQLDRRQWTKNAIELSSYFIEHRKFRQAILCLEASCAVAPQFNKDDEEDLQLEADIAKTWGILYLELLKQSYEVMNKLENEEKVEEKKPEKSDSVEEWIDNPKKLMILDKNLQVDNTVVPFENLDRFLSLHNSAKSSTLPKPPEMSLASTFEEAKELFVPGSFFHSLFFFFFFFFDWTVHCIGLKHLSSALHHYVLDGYVTDHVKITQKMSQMYDYLAYFENNNSNKCKMHKRRINMLSTVEEQLSPQAYLDIVQELDYEIAQAYRIMANLKVLEKKNYVYTYTSYTTNLVGCVGRKKPKKASEEKKYAKINELFLKSIHYFNKFVESYEYPPTNTTGEDPNKPREKAKIKDPNDRSQYLLAYFHLAAVLSVAF
ncbi:hypothetical protein RFI_18695, partial [Reticulomyxa filosa]